MSIIIKHVAAVATSVALAAGLTAVSATSAQAAKSSKLTSKSSSTEPAIPVEVCTQAFTSKPVDCATGRRLGKAEARYAQRHDDYYAGRAINNGSPIWVLGGVRVPSTQHVPVPSAFAGRDVVVTATLSSNRYPGCGWLSMLEGAAAQGEKVTLDRGEVSLTQSTTTRIRGSALTIHLPNIHGGYKSHFVDLTITRSDGKQHRITVLWSLRSVKDGGDTFTFGD